MFVSGIPTERGEYSWSAKTIGGLSEASINGKIIVVNDPTSVKNMNNNAIMMQTIVDNQLNIWLNNESASKIEIITLTGQIEKSFEHKSGHISVDCSTLNKGIYIVRITTSDNVIAKRMIKR